MIVEFIKACEIPAAVSKTDEENTQKTRRITFHFQKPVEEEKTKAVKVRRISFRKIQRTE